MTSDTSSRFSGFKSTTEKVFPGFYKDHKYTLKSSEESKNSSLPEAEILLIKYEWRLG